MTAQQDQRECVQTAAVELESTLVASECVCVSSPFGSPCSCGGDVPPHVGPAKGGGHQAGHRLDPWVVYLMDGTNDRRTERCRYERSENTGGNVAQKLYTVNKPVNDLNGGRGSHGDNVWTLALGGRHGGKIDGDIGGCGTGRGTGRRRR